jgi:hypothetical protein
MLCLIGKQRIENTNAMIDYVNIIIGIALMSLGLLIAIPHIKEKLDGKVSKYGTIMQGIFIGVGIFILGLVMLLRELF